MVQTASGRTASIVLMTAALYVVPAAAQGPGTITIGDLPPGKTVTITFDAVIVNPPTGVSVENQGTVKGTNFTDKLTDDPATGAIDDATVTPLDVVDVAVTKTDGVTSAVPGQTVVYTIVVSNAGPSNAPSVSVDDTFPAGLSCGWTSVAAGGATGNTNNAGPANLADTLNLPAGGSVTYTVTCAIPSSATGTLSNTASATVNSLPSDTKTELNTANNTATDNDTALTPQADLTITKSDSPDPVLAGDDLVYTIEVTNVGPSDAQGVAVTDTLPAGVTLVSTSGCAEDGSGGGVPTCTLGTIAAGTSKQYTITVTVDSSAADGSTLVNSASVAATTTLINTGNDSASESTTVQRRVDLVVTKTESADPVIAGSGSGNLTYVVTVQNDGPSDATGVALSEVLTLPSGVSIDSITPSGSTTYAPPNAATGTWTVGNLAAGDSETLTVVLTVGSSTLTGTDVISDTAEVTTVNETDSNAGNNSATEATSVLADADFGDAPDPTYPTLLASNGAFHVQPSALFLGAAVDVDADGQPTADADGDDTDLDGDDEDGVVFTSAITAGDSANLDVTASVGGGRLDAWVDFNADGDWADAGEQVFTNRSLSAGLNSLSFGVPADAVAGPTFARFRVSTAGGLSFDGQAADGEVEDYKLTIARESDLSVTLTDGYDPAAAGTVQLYTIEVTNDGPSDASNVELTHTLPADAYFLGVAPASTSCTLASGVVTCDLGALAAGDSTTLTAGVLIDARAVVSQSSQAAVSADGTDPDTSDDSSSATTNLAPVRSILPTARVDGGSTPVVALVAKEGEESVGLVVAESAGGGNRQYGVEALGFRPVALAEVPNFADTPSPEVAVLAWGFDGSTQVIVLDAKSRKVLQADQGQPAGGGGNGPRRIGPPLRAARFPIAGTWVPIGLQTVPNFGGTSAPEVAVLLRNLGDTTSHVIVLDAGSGAQLADHVVAGGGATTPFPIGMALVPDFGGSPAPELAVLTRNVDTGDVRVEVVDAGSGVALSSTSLGSDLFPLGLATAGNLVGTAAEELAVLGREPSSGNLPAVLVDPDLGLSLGAVLFDPDLLPGPIARVADFSSNGVPELAVAGRRDAVPDLVIEVRDALTGLPVSSATIAAPPLAPMPLGLAVQPSFGGSAADDLSLLFEFLGQPAEVRVLDAAGALLFSYVLP